jgi:hypothetical protein
MQSTLPNPEIPWLDRFALLRAVLIKKGRGGRKAQEVQLQG